MPRTLVIAVDLDKLANLDSEAVATSLNTASLNRRLRNTLSTLVGNLSSDKEIKDRDVTTSAGTSVGLAWVRETHDQNT